MSFEKNCQKARDRMHQAYKDHRAGKIDKAEFKLILDFSKTELKFLELELEGMRQKNLDKAQEMIVASGKKEKREG